MRAVLLKDQSFRLNQPLVLTGDELHHLVNVVRLRKADEILLLDGMGTKALAVVEEIQKKQLVLLVKDVTKVSPNHSCDVLVLIPKKDALELILKSCCELGVGRVLLLRGQYSQEKLPEARRLEALIQSAVEQSNNAWLPEVVLCEDWADIPLGNYAVTWTLDVGSSARPLLARNPDQKELIVVGPEAGFSQEERARFATWTNNHIVSFPTPILRAPTALIAGIGWWHSRT